MILFNHVVYLVVVVVQRDKEKMGMVVRRVSQVLRLTNNINVRNISFKSLDPPLPSPSLCHGIHVFHCPVSNSLTFHAFYYCKLVKEWFFDAPLGNLKMGFFNYLEMEIEFVFLFWWFCDGLIGYCWNCCKVIWLHCV